MCPCSQVCAPYSHLHAAVTDAIFHCHCTHASCTMTGSCVTLMQLHADWEVQPGCTISGSHIILMLASRTMLGRRTMPKQARCILWAMMMMMMMMMQMTDQNAVMHDDEIAERLMLDWGEPKKRSFYAQQTADCTVILKMRAG